MGECFIIRRGGDVYRLPILNANYPEDVTTTVIKGKTASASFNAVISEPGNPSNYTYQWYVDGIAVEGATGSSYVKKDLTATGKHTVYCEVTNKKGTVTTRIAALDVTQLYTPVLDDINPKNQTVARGTRVTCNVGISKAGSPASYTYQWYKDGEPVEGATDSSYSFDMTGIGIASVYCEVTNSAGTVITRTATINEYYDIAPNISVPWNTYKGSVGKTAEYTYIQLSGSNGETAYASCSVDLTPYRVMHLAFSADYDRADSENGTGAFMYGIFDENGGIPIVGGSMYRNAYDPSFYVDEDYDISKLAGTKDITFIYFHDRAEESIGSYALTKVRLEA